MHAMNLHVDHVAENKIAIRLFDRFLTADFYSDAIWNDRQECDSWEIYRMEKINEFEGIFLVNSFRRGAANPKFTLLLWDFSAGHGACPR